MREDRGGSSYISQRILEWGAGYVGVGGGDGQCDEGAVVGGGGWGLSRGDQVTRGLCTGPDPRSRRVLFDVPGWPFMFRCGTRERERWV